MTLTAARAALVAATFALGLPALAGCSAKDTDPGPGGVTVGEARTLDEAAEMLDARQLPERTPAATPAQKPVPAASDSAAP